MLSDELFDLVIELGVLGWMGYNYFSTSTLSTGFKVITVLTLVLAIKTLRNIVRIVRFRLSNKLIQSGVSLQGGVYDNLETMIRTNPEFRNYCRMLINRYDGGMF